MEGTNEEGKEKSGYKLVDPVGKMRNKNKERQECSLADAHTPLTS